MVSKSKSVRDCCEADEDEDDEEEDNIDPEENNEEKNPLIINTLLQ